jgi:hypothetical protein
MAKRIAAVRTTDQREVSTDILVETKNLTSAHIEKHGTLGETSDFQGRV